MEHITKAYMLETYGSAVAEKWEERRLLRLRPPPQPPTKKPTMVEAKAAIRLLVWELAHREGLAKEVLDWTVDLAQSEGREPPAEAARWREHEDAPAGVRAPFTELNVQLAAAALISARVGNDPWLRSPGPYELDSAVWRKDFSLPPGLAFQPRGNSVRTALINETGVSREVVPTRPSAGFWEDAEKKFLVPVELLTWFEENRF